jgi:hypothetical protein
VTGTPESLLTHFLRCPETAHLRIVGIFDLPVVLAVEFVRSDCVVFDSVVEVVEEFPVGI